MAQDITAFCRLCATMSPESKLVYLQENSETRKVTMSHLARLNCDVDWSRTDLPESVCDACSDSLQSAFEFVNSVELAQDALNKMLLERCIKPDKEEICDETETFKPELDSPSAEDTEDQLYNKSDQDEDEAIIEINGIDNNNLSEKDPLTVVKVEDKVVDKEDNMQDEIHIEEHNIAAKENNKEFNSITEKEDHNKINKILEKEKKFISDDDSSDENYISSEEDSDEKNISSEEDNEQNNISGKEQNTESQSSHLEPNNSWKDYIWICSTCEFLCGSFGELQTHLQESHKSCNRYRCTDCKKSFIRLVQFLKHVEIHRKYLNLSCFKCLTQFSHIGEARLHKLLHKPSDHTYSCDGCWRTFPSAADRDAHVNMFFHSTKMRPVKEGEKWDYVCPICNKASINQGSLIAHKALHTDLKPDICHICGRKFKGKGNLDHHVGTHDKRERVECKICKKSLADMKSLKKHVKRVHMKKNVIFRCDKCEKICPSKYNLQNHSLVHREEKPYSCKHCGKSFARKSYLKIHMLQHTGVKPFSCEKCQHDFTNQSNYLKHMKRRHGAEFRKPRSETERVETEELVEWKRQMIARKKAKNVRNSSKKPER